MIRINNAYFMILLFIMVSPFAIGADVLDKNVDENEGKSKRFIKEDLLLSMIAEYADTDPNSTTDEIPQKQGNTVDPNSITAKSDAVTPKTPEKKNNAGTTITKNRNLREKLQSSSIKRLPGQGRKIDSQLQDVLRQLQSLSFSEETEPSAKDIKPIQQITNEDIEKSKNQPQEKEIEPVSLPQEEPKQQLTVDLPEDVTSIVNVFELAESLFHIGDKANAEKYYRKALERTYLSVDKQNPKRAWILFQIGNCLYNKDKAEAVKVYEKLITDHPGSDWTNCARTKKQVLQWLLAEKPMEKTMKEAK